MTAVDLDVAMARSRVRVSAQDVWRDKRERDAKVRHLTACGRSATEIAEQVGCTDRHVVRLRSAPQPDSDLPRLPDHRSISDERAAEIDALAHKAFEWAGLLRDEDPLIVWQAMSRLSRHRLQELVIVALAMVPSDATIRELLGWAEELGVCGGE